MDFKRDADVITADGDKLGTVDRVVLDPKSNQVTHLVVRKGFLLITDKVLPVEMIESSSKDKVVLKDGEEDFEELPQFKESYYVPTDGSGRTESRLETFVPSLYWYPPMGTRWGLGVRRDHDLPHYKVRTDKNIPEGTIALKEGADAMSRDGEKVGDIERVITDNEHATHIVISEGLLLKEKKLVPVGWISMVFPEQVHLAVDAKFIDNLPEFEQ